MLLLSSPFPAGAASLSPEQLLERASESAAKIQAYNARKQEQARQKQQREEEGEAGGGAAAPSPKAAPAAGARRGRGMSLDQAISKVVAPGPLTRQGLREEWGKLSALAGFEETISGEGAALVCAWRLGRGLARRCNAETHAAACPRAVPGAAAESEMRSLRTGGGGGRAGRGGGGGRGAGAGGRGAFGAGRGGRSGGRGAARGAGAEGGRGGGGGGRGGRGGGGGGRGGGRP